ncbi:MAG: DNA helicase UvrD [Candidatus Levybacteria bacterium]|nr:DNA helicase UvrD [Candidatus Levybacteria bacterium]
MQFVTDLHLHSKYSRAVSQDMVLPIMAKYARQKGLDILTASDWTHPLWFKEIQAQLEEKNDGIYVLKSEIRNPKSEMVRQAHHLNHPERSRRTNPKAQNTNDQKETLFILSTEISSIYTQNGKLRRIHNLVFAPNFEIAEKISKELVRRGCNLNADGRPIIGLSSKALLEFILSIDERTLLVPCHVWTPHFGMYGSASGFDSLDESFEELSKYVYGIETGLSSDPEMNWQIKELRNRTILSFSDAHSPAKMGREATIMELAEPTYESIRGAIMEKSQEKKGENRIVYSVEFYPEEGKYHFSGHRNCGISFGPDEIKEKGTVCPVCHKRLTDGVLNRLLQLADKTLSHVTETKTNQSGLKWYTDRSKHHPPYVKLVPLLEIIAESMHSTVASQKVKNMFQTITTQCGSELDVLLKTPIEEIAKAADSRIAEGVSKVRTGDIVIEPGFDGEYGKVKIWQEGKDPEKNTDNTAQMSLDI